MTRSKITFDKIDLFNLKTINIIPNSNEKLSILRSSLNFSSVDFFVYFNRRLVLENNNTTFSIDDIKEKFMLNYHEQKLTKDTCYYSWNLYKLQLIYSICYKEYKGPKEGIVTLSVLTTDSPFAIHLGRNFSYDGVNYISVPIIDEDAYVESGDMLRKYLLGAFSKESIFYVTISFGNRLPTIQLIQ